MSNFNLLNSPAIYSLLTFLLERQHEEYNDEILKSAKECQVHNTMKVPRYAVLMAYWAQQGPKADQELVKLCSS